jgi:tRNA A37 methylthiotransferase MiaB
MEQIPPEVVERRVNILERIVQETTLKSLKGMVGKDLAVILEGESDEHEYLLSARPILWAKEIDGDILINDTSDLPIKFGDIYRAKVTELVGNRLLATLISRVS